MTDFHRPVYQSHVPASPQYINPADTFIKVKQYVYSLFFKILRSLQQTKMYTRIQKCMQRQNMNEELNSEKQSPKYLITNFTDNILFHILYQNIVYFNI